MIWLDIRELERRLKNGELTDKIAFSYLLTHLILLSIFSHIATDEDPVWSVWVHLFISLGYTVWGVRRSFEINQQGDSRDYLKRFLCLSFVVGVRSLCLLFFLLLLLTVAITVAGAVDASFFMSTNQKKLLELGLFSVWVGVYYHLLLSSFKRVSSGEVEDLKIAEE